MLTTVPRIDEFQTGCVTKGINNDYLRRLLVLLTARVVEIHYRKTTKNIIQEARVFFLRKLFYAFKNLKLISNAELLKIIYISLRQSLFTYYI